MSSRTWGNFKGAHERQLNEASLLLGIQYPMACASTGKTVSAHKIKRRSNPTCKLHNFVLLNSQVINLAPSAKPVWIGDVFRVTFTQRNTGTLVLGRTLCHTLLCSPLMQCPIHACDPLVTGTICTTNAAPLLGSVK